MSSIHRAHRSGFTLVEIMIVIAIIAILAAVMIPNFRTARAESQLTACKANLKTIATATELYATENQNHFAPATWLLLGTYLKYLPNCPSAPTAWGNNYSYTAASNPDAYTVLCMGTVHRQTGLNTMNYPQYTSSQGLVLP